MIGGGIMTITVVVACLVLSSSSIRVRRRPFLRDLIFYLIACSSIFILLLFRCVRLWQPLLLLFLYALYLIVIFVGRAIHQHQSRKRREALGIIEDADELMEITEMMDVDNYPDVMLDELLFVTNVQSPGESLVSDVDTESEAERPSRRRGNKSSESAAGVDGLLHELDNCIGWKEMSPARKALHVVTAPVQFIEHCTMPLVIDEYWRLSLFFITLSPIAIPIGVTSYYGIGTTVAGVPVILPALAVGVAIAAALYFLAPKRPTPKFVMLVVSVSVLMSTFWMYVIISEVLGVLRALAHIWGTSEVIMGLTLFAWGNGIVDLVSATEVAKQGFKNLAFSACVGASSFSLLFGLGFPVFTTVLVSDAVYEHTHIPSPFAVSFVTVGVAVLAMVVIVPLQNFHITRLMSVVLLAIYGVYGILILFTEFDVFPFLVSIPDTSASCK